MANPSDKTNREMINDPASVTGNHAHLRRRAAGDWRANPAISHHQALVERGELAEPEPATQGAGR